MAAALNHGKYKGTVIVNSINGQLSGTKLSCGIHDCPQRCHQLFDHSKMECHKTTESICSRNHKLSRPCFKKDYPCGICEAEDRSRELRRQRDQKLELEREIKQKEYTRQLTEIQDEIAHQRRILKDQSDQDERERFLGQQQQDLKSLRDTVGRVQNKRKKDPPPTSTMSQASTTTALPNVHPDSAPGTEQVVVDDQSGNGLSTWTSSARDEWEHQKEFEGARNEALDSLMDMIGLEDVKDKFLSIKSRVDTAVCQNIDVSEERFGASLLGNPGTGPCCWSYKFFDAIKLTQYRQNNCCSALC